MAAFERRLAGEYRVTIEKAPRSQDQLRRLTQWQRLQLAEALDVTTALKATARDYNRLDPLDQSYFIEAELRSVDVQHSIGFRDHTWTPLMRAYIERTPR